MRDRIKIREALNDFPAGAQLLVAGWARSVRVGKGVAFITMNNQN